MKKILINIAAITLLSVLTACQTSSSVAPIDESSEETTTSISEEDSSSLLPIIENQLYTENGLKVYFSEKGARIDKITWQDKQIAKDGFIAGRCANRIAGGTFQIDGVTYNVTKNDGANSLHGGGRSWQGAFGNATWTKVEQTFSSITYSLHSPDGEEGYPGNMDMTVKYELSEEGELTINYSATTDKDTICNPTNHLFIAINGNNSYDNINLWLNADYYTPLSNNIPTGQIASVVGTQFDYREEKAFDKNKNYDDNLVLNETGYREVASLKGLSLGIAVDVYTDRAGLQLYKDNAGNICLETQMFPDMINHPEFASYGTVILRKGETFASKTAYHFHAIDA